MKNLFEPRTVQEVMPRIEQLKPISQRRWGKMDVAQMMAHCSAALDMASGKLVAKREIKPRAQERDHCGLQPDARVIYRGPRENLKLHQQTKDEPQQNGE